LRWYRRQAGVRDGVMACVTIDSNTGGRPVQTRRPVRGDDVRLTSGFGMRIHPLLNTRRLHTGIDWSAPLGTPVIAAGGGRVSSAGVTGELGNAVRIDHGAGWQTLYALLAHFDVQEGDCVAFGTVIGKVGATGLTYGPTLHFELRQHGWPIDPLRLP
jgi:murein DD-endopeptidase MepM/ murein hydrolase activator NlpD